eukprot:GHVS01015047.1.p1 GENE.GHVS01015047.1~~GHVS01015047.1.p1  ORF type:complete len:200 (+),score=25.52 GHVS01015047.1:127-726(+)
MTNNNTILFYLSYRRILPVLLFIMATTTTTTITLVCSPMRNGDAAVPLDESIRASLNERPDYISADVNAGLKAAMKQSLNEITKNGKLYSYIDGLSADETSADGGQSIHFDQSITHGYTESSLSLSVSLITHSEEEKTNKFLLTTSTYSQASKGFMYVLNIERRVVVVENQTVGIYIKGDVAAKKSTMPTNNTNFPAFV